MGVSFRLDETVIGCERENTNPYTGVLLSIMLFIFCPFRITRNGRLSPLKLLISTYSSEAKPGVKSVSSSQKHQCASNIKSLQGPSVLPSLIASVDRHGSVLLCNTENVAIGKSLCMNDEEEWRYVKLDPSKLRKHCFMLSKIRLSALVVVTTMAGYALAPGPFDISTFVACSLGTGLVSATANAINQFFEVPFDSQMSRTKNRVLVRGHLTSGHAVAFAAVSGISGLLLLYSEVNGLTAALGVTNLILYTLIYTPMKRVSILNTWIGSIVGAIPPLMGWAACTGDIMFPGAWIMSGLLYAWQFPHFNALSWNLRADYSRAGYRMMAVTNPKLCRETTLRYTAALMGLCYLAPALGVTNWWFSLTSTPLNAYFLYLAWKFRERSDSKSSRKLFHFSLIHLPALMVLILATKKHYGEKKQKNTILHETKESDIYTILLKAIASISSTA